MEFGTKSGPKKCSRCFRTKEEAIKEQTALGLCCRDTNCTFKSEIRIALGEVRNNIYESKETLEETRKQLIGLRLSINRYKNRFWIEDYSKILKQIEDYIYDISFCRQNNEADITSYIELCQSYVTQLKSDIRKAKDKKNDDINRIVKYNGLLKKDYSDLANRFISLSEFKVETDRLLRARTERQRTIDRENELQDKKNKKREQIERIEKEECEKTGKILKALFIIALIIGCVLFVVEFWPVIKVILIIILVIMFIAFIER